MHNSHQVCKYALHEQIALSASYTRHQGIRPQGKDMGKCTEIVSAARALILAKRALTDPLQGTEQDCHAIATISKDHEPLT